MKYTYNTDQNVVISNMVAIDFVDGPEDGFRKVRETLKRMGIAKRDEKILIQTAHVLHKQGHYYICHFKEMFALDGREAELSEEDLGRRNLIVQLLSEWELITILSDNASRPLCSPRKLKILKHKEVGEWTTESKYSIGTRKRSAIA